MFTFDEVPGRGLVLSPSTATAGIIVLAHYSSLDCELNAEEFSEWTSSCPGRRAWPDDRRRALPLNATIQHHISITKHAGSKPSQSPRGAVRTAPRSTSSAARTSPLYVLDSSDPMSMHGYMVQPSMGSGSNLRRGSEGAAPSSSSSSNNPRPSSAQPQLRQQLSRPGSAPEQHQRQLPHQQQPQQHTKASLYQSASGLKGGVITNVYSRKAARSVTLSSSSNTSSLQPHPPNTLNLMSKISADSSKTPMSANANQSGVSGSGAISRLLERFSQSRSSGGAAASAPQDNPRNKSINGANLLTADPSLLEKQGARGFIRSNSTPSAGLTPTLHSASSLAAVSSSQPALDRHSAPLIADRGLSSSEMKPTPVITIGRTSAPAAAAPPSHPPNGQPLFVRRSQQPTSTPAAASTAASTYIEPSQPHPTKPFLVLTEEGASSTSELGPKSSIGLKAAPPSFSSPITLTPLFSPPSPTLPTTPNGLSSPQSPFRSLMIRIPGEANEHEALRQIPLIAELPMSSVTPSSHHKQERQKSASSHGQPSCDCMNNLMAAAGELADEFGLTDEWMSHLLNQLKYRQLLKSIEARRHSN